jgi:hypothetical protein
VLVSNIGLGAGCLDRTFFLSFVPPGKFWYRTFFGPHPLLPPFLILPVNLPSDAVEYRSSAEY